MEKFVYEKMKLENIPCNFCVGNDFFVLARRAANGLPAQTCLCKKCGLIFLNPRMSKDDYDEYYKEHYRAHRAASIGKTERAAELQVNFDDARKFGRALAKLLSSNIKEFGLTIDVGASTGGVLFGLREILPKLELLGVEPSLAESDFANQHGVKTHRALFEDFLAKSDVSKISNIICVRSLNHLLDPMSFFRWAARTLESDGSLILVVKNFRHQTRRAGNVAAGVQIDHPYMFTQETLKQMVEQAGFEVIYLDSDEYKNKKELTEQKEVGLSIHHIRLVAKKKNAVIKKFPRGLYWKMRWQFWPPFLKIYYLLFYSRRFKFFKFLR